VAELEARLSALKDRLPSEREMPGLYRTLTDAAAAAGLGVSLFQPRATAAHDVYTEIPIALNGEAG
jgi:Tfp pilus assembly protein PilO